MTPEQAIVLITGIQAAGKSTVAQLLAERLPRSVHVRGDLFRRMVINGRADMTPSPTEEAQRQTNSQPCPQPTNLNPSNTRDSARTKTAPLPTRTGADFARALRPWARGVGACQPSHHNPR
jgi:cytidylate kinase